MTAPLALYTHPQSRGRVARWVLEETGLPYDTQVLDYGTPMKAPAYLAINPMGKVPALTHGDAVVTENLAIVLYLADLVTERNLAPAVGTPERGAYYRWIAFMAPLEQLMTLKATGGALPSPTMAGFGTEADLLGTLEGALRGRDHLVGHAFTAADLLVAAYLDFYMGFKLLAPRPEFERFARLHMARPAAQRASALDDEAVARSKAAA